MTLERWEKFRVRTYFRIRTCSERLKENNRKKANDKKFNNKNYKLTGCKGKKANNVTEENGEKCQNNKNALPRATKRLSDCREENDGKSVNKNTVPRATKRPKNLKEENGENCKNKNVISCPKKTKTGNTAKGNGGKCNNKITCPKKLFKDSVGMPGNIDEPSAMADGHFFSVR